MDTDNGAADTRVVALLRDLNTLHQRGSLHILDRGDVCVGCGGQWPCRTRRIIERHALEALLPLRRPRALTANGNDDV